MFWHKKAKKPVECFVLLNDAKCDEKRFYDVIHVLQGCGLIVKREVEKATAYEWHGNSQESPQAVYHVRDMKDNIVKMTSDIVTLLEFWKILERGQGGN